MDLGLELRDPDGDAAYRPAAVVVRYRFPEQCPVLAQQGEQLVVAQLRHVAAHSSIVAAAAGDSNASYEKFPDAQNPAGPRGCVESAPKM